VLGVEAFVCSGRGLDGPFNRQQVEQRDRDEGSKNKGRNRKKVFPLHRNKDKTQECIVASQFMLTTELDDVKNPSLPCESFHPGFHSLLT